mmetsp:Transcript_23371/g.54179  ORF Transcript_23371/g.54179 Transcript_23371/m.54179 type:complete len:209 (+) Transcript_23371:1104-1730(+)
MPANTTCLSAGPASSSLFCKKRLPCWSCANSSRFGRASCKVTLALLTFPWAFRTAKSSGLQFGLTSTGGGGVVSLPPFAFPRLFLLLLSFAALPWDCLPRPLSGEGCADGGGCGGRPGYICGYGMKGIIGYIGMGGHGMGQAAMEPAGAGGYAMPPGMPPGMAPGMAPGMPPGMPPAMLYGDCIGYCNAAASNSGPKAKGGCWGAALR